MKITKEILEKNDWESRYGDYADQFLYKHIENESGEFDLEFASLSNMVGRDWYIHVDNQDFQTIGGCSVETIEQFNDFMKLLEIDYELEAI